MARINRSGSDGSTTRTVKGPEHARPTAPVRFSRCDWTSAEGFERGIAALRFIRETFADVVSGDLPRIATPKRPPNKAATDGGAATLKRLHAELDRQVALSAAFHDAARFARANPDCGVPLLAAASEPVRPDLTARQRLLHLILDLDHPGPGRKRPLLYFLRGLDEEISSWRTRGLMPNDAPAPDRDRRIASVGVERNETRNSVPRGRGARFCPTRFTDGSGKDIPFVPNRHMLATEVTAEDGLAVPDSTFHGWKKKRLHEKRPPIQPIGTLGRIQVFDRRAVMRNVEAWKTRPIRRNSPR